MPHPELSVVIPTHGRHHELARAVGSALGQDVDLEVIVVDDASPEAVSLADERVRIVRLEQNGGPAAARNAGAAAAKADWIAFLDSDDVWKPYSLRPRLEAAQGEGDANAIWAAGFVDVWPDGRRTSRIPKSSGALVEFVSGCWMCPGSTALFSREVWQRSGGQDESLRRLEDYDWLLRWAQRGGRLEVHEVIAAEITRGARAAPQAIAEAATYLRRKHAGLPDALKRRMESYIALETAVSQLHAGDALGGAHALLRSWMLRPRLQPALGRYWRVGAGASPD